MVIAFLVYKRSAVFTVSTEETGRTKGTPLIQDFPAAEFISKHGCTEVAGDTVASGTGSIFSMTHGVARTSEAGRGQWSKGSGE